jgi:hypothetical protein
MTIRKTKKIVIDLNSSDGNAFVLLATAKNLCRQLHGSEWHEKWDDISKDMKSGDYENLIKVFDENFGAFVDLLR